MSTTDTDGPIGSGPAVGRTGHVWPCTRFYLAADERDECTCTPVPAPDTERDERLRGIQERAAAATEGPWEVTGGPHSDLVVKAPGDRFVTTTGDPHYDGTVTDAAFIAAARTDVPWLLAEVTRLDAVVTAVRELHQPVQIDCVSRACALGDCVDEHPDAAVCPVEVSEVCAECTRLAAPDAQEGATLSVVVAYPCPTVRACCDHDRRTTYEDPDHRAWVCQHCGDEGTEDKT